MYVNYKNHIKVQRDKRFTQRMLEAELNKWKEKPHFMNFKPISMSKKKLIQEIENAENVEYYDYFYCCYGMRRSCWTEMFAEGVWDFTTEGVKHHLIPYIHDYARYVYSNKHGNRFYKCEQDGYTWYLLVMRDFVNRDMLIRVK